MEDEEKPSKLRAFLAGLLRDPAAKGLGAAGKRGGSNLRSFFGVNPPPPYLTFHTFPYLYILCMYYVFHHEICGNDFCSCDF